MSRTRPRAIHKFQEDSCALNCTYEVAGSGRLKRGACVADPLDLPHCDELTLGRQIILPIWQIHRAIGIEGATREAVTSTVQRVIGI